MFEGIYNMLNRAKNLDESKAFRFAVDSDIKKLIISLNTVEQLGKEGIDSDGDSLGEYAPFTKQKKLTEGVGIGKIIDHITFYENGDYWNSWTVNVKGDDIEIIVNKERFDELVNELGFSPDHVGLTDENLTILAEKMRPKYIEYARRTILG